MGWVQRNKVTPEESRRLFEEHRWLMLGSLFVFFVALLVIPIPLIFGDAPVGLVMAGGLVFMFAFGVGFQMWATRKIEAMRAGSPPDVGGQHGGERPGG